MTSVVFIGQRLRALSSAENTALLIKIRYKRPGKLLFLLLFFMSLFENMFTSWPFRVWVRVSNFFFIRILKVVVS